MAERAPLFVLVAGETSGDVLAAGLMRALRAYYPQARFEGVTGPLMRAEGCISLADIEELSLFGISEVIGEIPRVLALRRRLARHIRASGATAFVGIDAPAFNTGLEQQLRQSGLTTIHYVCPTAWAWRAGRTKRIRKAVDLMLAIFPFEPAFFARYDIAATYVGHPLADALPLYADSDAARHALGLSAEGRLVGLLPGSRRSEASRLGPVFIETARWLSQRLPDLRFVAPMATPAVRTLFEAQLTAAGWPIDIELVDGRSRDVMRASDALLLASGTATLEALLAKTPMVVAYRLSESNYFLARSLNLIKVEHVSMPNLLAGRALVPELLQDDADPAMLGPWLYRLLTSQTARNRQISAFEAIHRQLACDADATAANAVFDLVESRR